MYQLRFCAAFAASLLLSMGSGNQLAAEFIQPTFSLTGTTGSASQYEYTQSNLTAGGVTFDATVTVTGGDANGAGSLTRTASTGLGVLGGSRLLNEGEWLFFSVATSNVSGGSVFFDGFVTLDLASFQTGDRGRVSHDDSHGGSNLIGDPVTTDPFSFPSPPSVQHFYLVGQPHGEGVSSTSFRASAVEGRFSTAAAVPLPSTVALAVSGLSLFLAFRRRLMRPTDTRRCVVKPVWE